MAFEFLINNLWAVAVIAIIIAFIVGYKIQSRKVSKRDMRISELEQELKQKQTKAYTLGISQMKGDICQILGTFGILEEYQDIIMLSTTTKQSSLDLIGIKEDSVDFLEFKKKGTGLTSGERRLEQLIRDKKVDYKIFETELPDNIKINEREERIR